MSRPSRLLNILLAVVISLFFVSSTYAQTITVNKVAEPPIQWPRSHQFDMQHMSLKLSFDWDKETVFGEATLKLTPFINELKTVELDATKFKVDSVKLSSGANLKYQVTEEKILVTLDRVYKPNEIISFIVKYSAQPKLGLVFIKPTKTDPARPFQIWSQGETETNREWFPCYDSPNDRATTETIVTVDSKYSVISNGELILVTENNNKKTYHWKMDYPFSSYLVSLVVGEFAELKQEADGIPIFHYVYKDQLENAKVSFATVPKMMSFFANKLGHPYPYKKYAEITAYDFPGGMENITATTMTDGAVKDKRALIDNNDALSAHELAHQWFGNLVTCRDWSELWLNEGFANFMDAVWLEHSQGKEEYLRDFLEARKNVIERFKQGNRRPISTKRFYHPDDLFDENSYARPQLVIHMLRQLLGEKAFWQSINHYIAVNKNRGLVTTADLSRAIEDVTGENLDWFFEQWIYKLGQPELEVTSFYDEKKKQVELKIKQTQKKDPKLTWFEVAEIYRLPLEIAITTEKETKIHFVTIDQREQILVFPAETQPLIVNFDRGNHILKTIKFSRTSDELVYQLSKDEDVMGRIRAAAELKGSVYEAAIEALAKAAKTDKSSLVRLQAIDSLSESETETARNTFLSALSDSSWQVRERAITILGELKDKNLLPTFQKVIKEDVSYKTVAAAAKAVGLIGTQEAVDTLLALAQEPSWQQTFTQSSLVALGYTQDERILPLALKYAAPGNSKYVRSDAIALLGARAKGNQQALEYLQAALLEKSTTLNYSAIMALSEMNDSTSKELLEKFSKRPNLDANLKNYVNYVLDQLNQQQRKAGN